VSVNFSPLFTFCSQVRINFPRLPLHFRDSRSFGKKPNGCPGSQLQAEVAVPSIGFIWKSDPLNMSKSHSAILEEEINGRYCCFTLFDWPP
jgi:hypothetical protein